MVAGDSVIVSRAGVRTSLGSLTVTLLDTLMLARSGVDRMAERRSDDAWIAGLRSDPASRLVCVHAGGAPVQQDDAGVHLVLRSVTDTDAPPDDVTFLGVDPDDVAYFVEHVPDRECHGHQEWGELRTVGSRLDDRDAGLLVTAVALDNWRGGHQRCPRCGALTITQQAGWSRRCASCETQHFPRTDPAVIVLVKDEDDRALLGRQGRWEEGWFSTLAGFVDPGESAEAAVRREVQEESGVVIGAHPDDVEYLGSQPWPFPASLMLGYHARAVQTDIEVDGEEIAQARWFSRAELVAECEAGTVRLPPDISIARRLIERWFGAELPGDWSRPISPRR
jgi:NAD+ diphosphatase